MTTHIPKIQRKFLRFKKLLPLIGIGALQFSASSHALTIQLNDIGEPSMTSEQLSAFEEAAAIWEKSFHDPITIQLNIAWQAPEDFASPTHGARASIRKTTAFLSNVKEALKNDAFFLSEANVYDNIPVPLSVLDTNGGREEYQVTLSSANAKALRLDTGADPQYGEPPANNADGSLFFNLGQSHTFDLNRSDGIDPNKYDFIGMAAHEIGHVLGFFSVTDTQDANPTLTMHPNTLDIWRHELTNNYHAGDDVRIITAGGAEYFDTKLDNVPFSKGLAETDPFCQSSGQQCDAGHWRGGSGNLMDPGIAKGTLLNPTNEDLHALDYIGYNRNSSGFNVVNTQTVTIWKLLAWAMQPMCRACYQQIAAGLLVDYPIPPNPSYIRAPFNGANHIMLFGFNTFTEGLRNRSATGYAKFVGEKKNTITTVINSPNIRGARQWEQIESGAEPTKLIPAHLADFYFETDSKNGVKFYFRAVRSEAGIPFNPSLGKYGGFRVSGTIDATGDRRRGDTDGNMTFELLLNEPVDINKGFANSSFGIDISMEDNEITIRDFSAFGLRNPNSRRTR